MYNLTIAIFFHQAVKRYMYLNIQISGFSLFLLLQHIDQSLLETLYRHRSTLETIFRIVDTDNSGKMVLPEHAMHKCAHLFKCPHSEVDGMVDRFLSLAQGCLLSSE